MGEACSHLFRLGLCFSKALLGGGVCIAVFVRTLGRSGKVVVIEAELIVIVRNGSVLLADLLLRVGVGGSLLGLDLCRKLLKLHHAADDILVDTLAVAGVDVVVKAVAVGLGSGL